MESETVNPERDINEDPQATPETPDVPGEGADRQGDPGPDESGSDQSERADK